MEHDLGDEYMGSAGGHRHSRPERHLGHDGMYPSKRSVPGSAQGGRDPRARDMAEPNSNARIISDWRLYNHDRNHGTDLGLLRQKEYELDAGLKIREADSRPYDKTDFVHAQAIVFLLEIRDDIAKLERGEPLDHSDRLVTGHGRGGHRQSDHLKSRSNHAALKSLGRHPGGLGHGSRRGMTEADIASTTRDFSRLGFGSREGAHGSGFEDIADVESTHRSRGSRHGGHAPSIGYGRSSDYGDLEPTYQPHGSRHGAPPLSAGHGHSSSRHPGHGLGPQIHRHDVEEPDVQPLGSQHGGLPPSAGQGRTAHRHSSLRSGQPSRRHDLESYSVEEPGLQPLGSQQGGSPPLAGHGRTARRHTGQ